jgi:hypothetical protein
MVEDRSKQACKTWLAEQEAMWRAGVEVVVMDGFHRVQDRRHRRASKRGRGDGSLPCRPVGRRRARPYRRRVQQDTFGHRGRKDDPLYAARRILHTGAGLLTDGQRQLTDLFAADEHVQVEATWGVDP